MSFCFLCVFLMSIHYHNCNAEWEFKSQPSSKLQSLFNLESSGWIGGDEDTSLQLQNSVYLWLFGDTLIGNYNSENKQRSNAQWIHSSIGLYNITNSSQKTVDWIWKTSESNKPEPFFDIVSNDSSYDFVWVCVGITNNKNKAFLLSQEVKSDSSSGLGFDVVGTTAIVMDYDLSISPLKWNYTYKHFPNTNRTFNWFSAVIYVSQSSDEVYLIGTMKQNINILSKSKLNDLLEFNFENMQFWGWNRNDKQIDANLKWIDSWSDVGAFKYIITDNVGTSETTIEFSNNLNYWYNFRIPFGSAKVQLYLSQNSDIKSNYTKYNIYDIPYPWNNGSKYMCYSAKGHSELIAKNNNKSQLIFTYVCNTNSEPDLFDPGNAQEPVYIPGFIKVDYSVK